MKCLFIRKNKQNIHPNQKVIGRFEMTNFTAAAFTA
jgi:hypothetical protein